MIGPYIYFFCQDFFLSILVVLEKLAVWSFSFHKWKKKSTHMYIGNCFALNNNFYHFNWSEKISFCLWNRAFACHQKRSNISRFITDGSTLALNSYQEIVPIKWYMFESDAKKNMPTWFECFSWNWKPELLIFVFKKFRGIIILILNFFSHQTYMQIKSTRLKQCCNAYL